MSLCSSFVHSLVYARLREFVIGEVFLQCELADWFSSFVYRIKKMIKRRFFKLDHGDRDASDPSSSSDSELEALAETTEEESSEDDATIEAKRNGDEAGSTSSGWFIDTLLTAFCFDQ